MVLLTGFILSIFLGFLLIYFLNNTFNSRKIALSYIKGCGVEIGALHRPFCRNMKDVHVKYVDLFEKEHLAKLYPELMENIIAPDIIAPADDLFSIKDNSQDFVIASHILEHLGSPIKALLEWTRVIRIHGRLVLIVPDKRFTFDKNRPRTKLSELIREFKEPSPKKSESSGMEHLNVFIYDDVLELIYYLISDLGYSLKIIRKIKPYIFTKEMTFILEKI